MTGGKRGKRGKRGPLGVSYVSLAWREIKIEYLLVFGDFYFVNLILIICLLEEEKNYYDINNHIRGYKTIIIIVKMNA